MAEEAKQTGEVEMTGADELASYATNVNVSFRPEEVFLEFGQVSVMDQGRVRRIAAISMSVSHAKRLMQTLQRSLERHERLFGEVPSDPTSRLTDEGKLMLGISDLVSKAHDDGA